MKLDFFTSRARYLALVLPLFALFSTVHGGCIRGPAGYGTYGNYGYGGRATASATGFLDPDEGECVVHDGDGAYSSYHYGNCDDGDGDTYDGYGSSGGNGGSSGGGDRGGP